MRPPMKLPKPPNAPNIDLLLVGAPAPASCRRSRGPRAGLVLTRPNAFTLRSGFCEQTRPTSDLRHISSERRELGRVHGIAVTPQAAFSIGHYFSSAAQLPRALPCWPFGPDASPKISQKPSSLLVPAEGLEPPTP